VLGVFPQGESGEGAYEGEPRPIGTAATIVRMAKAPDGSVHAILQGISRIELFDREEDGALLMGRVKPLEEVVDRNLELEAMMRDIVKAFQRVVSLTETMPNELSSAVTNVTEPSALADFVAANLQLSTEERYSVLTELNVNKRLACVRDLLSHEVEVLECSRRYRRCARAMDRRQREFILREQLKAIQKELGEGDITPELSGAEGPSAGGQPAGGGAERSRPRAAAPDVHTSMSPEYQVARTYLEWLPTCPGK
jgi:ATP-dependent Lon protease